MLIQDILQTVTHLVQVLRRFAVLGGKGGSTTRTRTTLYMIPVTPPVSTRTAQNNDTLVPPQVRLKTQTLFPLVVLVQTFSTTTLNTEASRNLYIVFTFNARQFLVSFGKLTQQPGKNQGEVAILLVEKNHEERRQ